jgi:hypothetical protein
LIESPSTSVEYWGAAFILDDADLDFVSNKLLEDETPLTTEEMAHFIIRRRIEREAEAAKHREQGAVQYLPKDAYAVGQKLAFTKPRALLGTVVAVRPGRNPDHGDFDVIRVDFGEERQRDFAARLANHPLNAVSLSHGETDLSSPEEVFTRYGTSIIGKLEARLKSSPEIVRLADRWFPRALLATVNAGHLNLAEAVLDMAGGGPLPTEELLKDVGFPANINSHLQAFSLHAALQDDQRFDEVGPAGQVQWFLRRLEPPEVAFPPRRLESAAPEYDASILNAAMQALETELDDELSPVTEALPAADEVPVTLTFPHRRVGTLPLSPRLAPLFPTAYESPRVRFMLVDGETGEMFPGWVVRAGKYVYGLDEWYKKLEFPVGGQLTVSRGATLEEVVVKAGKRRPNREWVRTAAPAVDGRLLFTMQKKLVGINYDDLMMVAVDNPVAVDEAWLKLQHVPFARLVADVFRELAKLNPQSAVHAKTLYAAVNVVRRCPPGPIFAQLLSHAYYTHVGDAYWRFDQSQWTE